MYSRTIPISKRTERVATHQRLVRAARRAIAPYLPTNLTFPSAKQIIHFEGKNGPDGLASKHSVNDDPPDFFNPKNPSDRALLTEIKNRIYNLHVALKKKNSIRVNFEAAWLSHVVIDGLTPAHHQPFKEQLKEIDPRESHEISSRFKRIFYSGGDSAIESFVLNWKRLGPHGLGTNHMMFEAGIDFLVMPMSPRSLAEIEITSADLKKIKSGRFISLYTAAIKEINTLNMFERYEESSWTTELATEVREKLIPVAVRMVVLAWLAAVYKGK